MRLEGSLHERTVFEVKLPDHLLTVFFSLFSFIILGKMPTVVSPELYRTRFCEAMDKYFLMVPDHWTGLGLNCWNETLILKWTMKERDWSKGPPISYIWLLCHIHHSWPRPFSSVQAVCNWGLKFRGFAFWFLMSTNWLSLDWKVAWTFFSLKQKYRHISKG